MKKTVYMKFDVDAESYQEAEHKVANALNAQLKDTILDKETHQMFESRKFVNKVKM